MKSLKIYQYTLIEQSVNSQVALQYSNRVVNSDALYLSSKFDTNPLSLLK